MKIFKVMRRLGLSGLVKMIDSRWKNVNEIGFLEKEIKSRGLNKVILFMGHQAAWDTFHQRPQNLAKEFGKKDWAVIYCMSPYVNITPDKGVFGIQEVEPNVFLYSDISGWELGGLDVDLIYSCYPSHWDLASNLRSVKPKAKLVFDLFDDLSLFAKNEKDSRDFQALINEADSVAYTASALQKYIDENKKCLKIPNAVNVDMFSSLERKKVCYYGAIDYWFDFDSVEEAVKNLPEVVFVFAGVVASDQRATFESLCQYQNVEFLGSIKYTLLPSIFSTFDLGIIPFILSPMIHAVNPIKMHEYKAMGLTVVSTKMQELIDEDGILFYSDEKSLLSVIQEITTGQTVKKNGNRNKNNSLSWRDAADAIEKLVYNEK